MIALRTPLIFLKNDSIDVLELPLISLMVSLISFRSPWMSLRLQLISLRCPQVFQWFPEGFQ